MPFKKKIYPPLDIIILVYDLKTGDEIRNHKINYNDTNRRRWLQSICYWAWNNNCSIEMHNAVDKELAEKEIA